MLHLSNYTGFREHYLNPESITQNGIASAVDIARNHVPRAMGALNSKYLIIEMKGRVKGSERRKKVYFLSEKGVQMAKALKERQRNVDAFSLDIPGTEGFIGRESEIKEIKKELASENTVLISGEHGIGKTYLASIIVEGVSKDCSVIWYGFSDNGNLLPMLRTMSESLSRKGIGLLGYHLGTASELAHEELMVILKDTMNNCIIVLDDIQNADEKAIDFISLFTKRIKKFDKVQMILVSNSNTDYSFGDFKKIELSGLDRKSVRKILEEKQLNNDFDDIYNLTCAHPLFLKIIQSIPASHCKLSDYLENEIWKRMPDAERKVMKILSVFSNPVSLDIFSKEKGADYQVIMNLIDLGLVQGIDEKTFDSHRLLKDFFYSKITPTEKKKFHSKAAAHLKKEADEKCWLEAQRHYLKAGKQGDCARYIVTSGLDIIRKGLKQELEGIIDELNNEEIEEALWAELLLLRGYISKLKGEWKKALDDYQEALGNFEKLGAGEKQADALAKIGRVYLEKGEFDQARSQFDRAMDLLGRVPHILKARIYDELATIHLRKREIKEAETLAEEALEMAVTLKDKEMEAKVHNTMGNLHMTKGSWKDAQGHYEKSLDYLDGKDEQMAVILNNNLAIISFKAGDVEKALELWRLAAEKAERMKNLNVMLTFSNLGSIYFSIGNWKKAEEYCLKALDISESVGKDMITAASRSTMGHIQLHREEAGWEEHYQEALKLRLKLDDKKGQASSHNDLARGHTIRKNMEDASQHSEKALSLAQETGDGEQAVRAHLGLAKVAGAKKNNAEAKEFLKQALVKSREIKNNELLGHVYRDIGLVSAMEGEDFVAERYLKESIDILEDEKRPLELGQSLYEYGKILEQSGLGNPEEYLNRSREIFTSLGLPEKPVFLKALA